MRLKSFQFYNLFVTFSKRMPLLPTQEAQMVCQPLLLQRQVIGARFCQTAVGQAFRQNLQFFRTAIWRIASTFDSNVYKYQTDHEQQLVYVALSRVTNIEGLFIVTKNDIKLVFKHGRTICESNNMRYIRDEFLRLENHKLPTITASIKSFVGSIIPRDILLLNCNVQSLSAHCEDIDADSLMQNCNFLTLSVFMVRTKFNPRPKKFYLCSQQEQQPNSKCYRRCSYIYE